MLLLLLLLLTPHLLCGYELQEWLANRANRMIESSARSWWEHGFGDERARCTQNSDCQYRLGTQISRSSQSGLVQNPGYPGYWQPADSSPCRGFETGDGTIDPNAGIECTQRGFNFNPLPLTWVHYLDMQCIERRCTNFNEALPGYGKPYCHPTFRYNVGGGLCPANLQCIVPGYADPDIVNPPTGILYWDQPVIFQFSGYLGFSKDPRDVIGTCTCTSDTQCPPGQLCDPATGTCWCTASAQCTGHNGGIQLCLSNPSIGARLSLPSLPRGSVAGQCGCVVGREDSCSYNGMCRSISDLFPRTTFPAYYQTEALATQTTPAAVPMGRCDCYGKDSLFNVAVNIDVFGAGGPSNYIYNETVVGPACEYDSYRDHRCSGHGNPICTTEASGNGVVVLSKNGGGFIGYRCNRDSFPFRGQFACQCDSGYYPDNTVNNPSLKPCQLKLDCPNSLSSVSVNGRCECSGTTYDDGTGVCLEGCSGAKGQNHGICFYNPKFITGPASAPYNNDVKCTTPGWRTLYNPFAPDSQRYYATFYDGSVDDASGAQWIRLKTAGSGFCDVPYNEITGRVCGVGTWSDAYKHCDCSAANAAAGLMDLNKKLIEVFKPQDPVPYCAQSCQVLSQNMASEYNDLACGGPKRGACISDGFGGKRCGCNNGYTGLACETAVCPRARGRMCSGSGVCDHATGVCVCSFGFHGIACEFRANDCGASQPVLSYPLPDNSQTDL